MEEKRYLQHFYDIDAFVCTKCNTITQRHLMPINALLSVFCPNCHSDSVMPDATHVIMQLEEEVDALKSENKRLKELLDMANYAVWQDRL